MLTTLKLGHGGRIGNQLFHYASLIGMSEKHGHELKLRYWDYSRFFIGDYPEGFINPEIIHNDQGFHYDDCKFLSRVDYKDKSFALEGYWQSEKYWANCKANVLAMLKWDTSFEIDFYQKYAPDYERPIAIHIRRGDYLQNKNYHNLQINYYIQALYKFFPDWKDRDVVVFSDDIEYCKLHFSCFDNIHFSESKKDIEDLYLMSTCHDFILSNSTFAWWGAYLANRGKVIRPSQYFEGDLKLTHDTKDFWPESWIEYDYTSEKINLKDVTFTIPIFYDHPDRKKNIDLSVCMLQHYFDTNIIVNENRTTLIAYMGQYVDYFHSDHPVFHRTKMLNEMAERSETPIIFNWDADVVIAPMQILKAVELMRSGIDMVYPYDGTFARVPRLPYFKQLEQKMDIGLLAGITFRGMYPQDKKSFGGAVMWNKKSFLKAGGENENFISFGAEDYERYERSSKLGYKIERVTGSLYHIDHYIGVNSSTNNPYFNHNRVEYEKVKGMDKEQLIKYIETWE